MAVPARRLHRAAVLSVLTAMLVATAACSSTADPDEGEASAQAYGAQEPVDPAPPGRFKTLPEPCGAVPVGALRQIQFSTMGGATEAPDDVDPEEAEEALRGKPTVTFDTDRKAGCEWMWPGTAATGSRGLTVDFERVVSYDTTVSDEDQARADYRADASRAGVPTGSSTPDPDVDPVGDEPEDGQQEAPRLIGGIGDEAFLTEHSADDDAPPHQEVRLIFRQENVIVTVQYQQWPLAGTEAPSDGGLQRFAHMVAQGLADRLGQQ